MGQNPIHKDKEECQAALSRGEHVKDQILRAAVTFSLSQYCSLPTARAGANEQGEPESPTSWPISLLCVPNKNITRLYYFMLPQFLWSLADAAGKKPISIQSILHTKGYLRHTQPYDTLNIIFPHFKDEDTEGQTLPNTN